MTAYIRATEDANEKAALIEQLRREYPDQWKPVTNYNHILFRAYVTTDPAKALAFAQEILKGIENDKSEPTIHEIYLRYHNPQWKGLAAYAQALVQVRSLMAEKKYAEALALLEKIKPPLSMGDSFQLVLLKAEAANGAGDAAKAYDLIASPLLKAMDTTLHSELVKYGAKLGKSAEQVDGDLWARRMQKAEPFKEFDLKKMGSDERLKLADLRGKVVMVDFWFPT